MTRHMQDQKRRNALVLGNVVDGRKVTVLGGIVAELFTMAELLRRHALNAPARLRNLDDGRYVVGVAIDRHAPFEHVEPNPLRLQVSLICAVDGRQLRAGGMPAPQQRLWSPAN